MLSKKSIGSWWAYPPRKLGQLMTVVALSGLAMSAIGPRGPGRAGPPRAPRMSTSPRAWSLANPPLTRVAPEVNLSFDAGIYKAAPQGIDNRFVVDAPQGIDARMIVEAPGGLR